MSVSDFILVFDIGGTSLRAAGYAPVTGELGDPCVIPTPNRLNSPGLSAGGLYKRLLGIIAEVGNDLMADRSVTAVSIAFPGPVTPSGHVLAAPGIWGRNPEGPIPLAEDVRALWPNLDIFVSNDLSAAGFRYVETGDESFCLVTVSTGIGSKIFIQGQPQLGPSGTGGEIGHARVSFSPSAPVCDCGDRGHLQAFSSGRGVLESFRQQAKEDPGRFETSFLRAVTGNPDDVTNRDLAEAYRASDPLAVEVVNQSATPLAAMLVNLYLALGLEQFIIIGGFAFALGESYRLELSKQAARICWVDIPDWDRAIRFGNQDDLSGLIGAGRLASRRPGKT